MPTLNEMRDKRMYEEHQPPQPGLEEAIMEVLGAESIVSPKELIDKMKQQGFPKSEVTSCVWRLIDRGFIELTFNRQLQGHIQVISPAPVDLV